MAVLLIWAGRRFVLKNGRLFALYIAAYTFGRAWVEALRVDHANHFFGLRLNDWTSLIVFIAAVAYLVLHRSRADRCRHRLRRGLSRLRRGASLRRARLLRRGAYRSGNPREPDRSTSCNCPR